MQRAGQGLLLLENLKGMRGPMDSFHRMVETVDEKKRERTVGGVLKSDVAAPGFWPLRVLLCVTGAKNRPHAADRCLLSRVHLV